MPDSRLPAHTPGVSPRNGLPFGKVSFTFLCNRDATPDARLMYAIMTKYADTRGRTGIAGVRRLAEDFGCDERKARRLLGELVQKGMIQRTPRYERMANGAWRQTTDEWTLLDAQDVIVSKRIPRQPIRRMPVINPSRPTVVDEEVPW